MGKEDFERKKAVGEKRKEEQRKAKEKDKN